jgi:hypothetical protein
MKAPFTRIKLRISAAAAACDEISDLAPANLRNFTINFESSLGHERVVGVVQSFIDTLIAT